MAKRKRITRRTALPLRVSAADMLAQDCGVGYNQALRAISIANEMNDDRSVLQRCQSILAVQKQINNFKSKKFRKVS